MQKVEISRIAADAQQVTNARVRSFVYSSYLVPAGTKYVILSVGFVAHTINGERSENAVLVINIGHKETVTNADGTTTNKDVVDEVLYVRSFLKPRRDVDGVLVRVKGTLNQYIATHFVGKTLGEVETYLLKLVGKEVVAVVTSYKGMDRNGDVRDIDVNGWDLVGDFPA